MKSRYGNSIFGKHVQDITTRPRRARTNQDIIREARRRYAGITNFSTTIKGLKCLRCDSRDTDAEFYRSPPMRYPVIGVIGCNKCGAC